MVADVLLRVPGRANMQSCIRFRVCVCVWCESSHSCACVCVCKRVLCMACLCCLHQISECLILRVLVRMDIKAGDTCPEPPSPEAAQVWRRKEWNAADADGSALLI